MGKRARGRVRGKRGKIENEVGGFGRIAVSTRFSDPAIEFFNNWSFLITKGLRYGDCVLLPNMKRVFAHFAANNIIKEFLKEDADSLLFIDDDMVFSYDYLERLRSNKENWQYDVVGGFYTSRGTPPKPMVLRWREEQLPDAPMVGWAYNFYHDWEKGDTVEVDAMGLGFTLIRRKVLEDMLGDRNPERYGWFFFPQMLATEDMTFSFYVRGLGYRMAIDTGVSLGHMGKHMYGMDDYLQSLDAQGHSNGDEG